MSHPLGIQKQHVSYILAILTMKYEALSFMAKKQDKESHTFPQNLFYLHFLWHLYELYALSSK